MPTEKESATTVAASYRKRFGGTSVIVTLMFLAICLFVNYHFTINNIQLLLLFESTVAFQDNNNEHPQTQQPKQVENSTKSPLIIKEPLNSTSVKTHSVIIKDPNEPQSQQPEQVEKSATSLLSIKEPLNSVLKTHSVLTRDPINYTLATEVGCCGRQRTLKITCAQTCYTKEACNESSLFPFRSKEEADFFEPRLKTLTVSRNLDLSRWCWEKMKEPPVLHVCGQGKDAIAKENVQWADIPTGCSDNGRMAGLSGPFDRMILFPEAKLAFCGIPKVGISQWLKFLRFTFGANDWQAVPHYKNDVKALYFDKLPRQRQLEILQDTNWTKAIFFRDPAERLLSAFLDKVIGSPYYKKPHLKTLADFVKHLQEDAAPNKCPKGPSWCWDPHWRPQMYSCGINKLLPYFDFVGTMDNSANQTRQLLEMTGLWQGYGAIYQTSEKTNKKKFNCDAFPPNDKEKDPADVISTGFQQHVPGRAMDGHDTNSRSKIDHFYNTSGLLEAVHQLYKDDYVIWDALQEHNGSWVKGSVLADQLNSACSKKEQVN